MGTQAVNQHRDQIKSSPFAGCSLVLAAMISMLFLVGFVVWNLFKLDSEISKFTSDTPVPTPVPNILESTKKMNELKAKLNDFVATAETGEEETVLSLSATDLNLAVAAYDPFEDLRTTFSIKEIKDGRLYIQVSYPMRGKPMTEEFRYLNGTQVAIPRLLDGEIILEIEKILVTDASVPSGFLGQLSPHRITNRYKEDELLGPWMSKLTSVEISGDQLLLKVTPGIEKPLIKGTTEIKPAIKRALILFGIFLALFVISLSLIIYFKRARQKRLSPVLEEE